MKATIETLKDTFKIGYEAYEASKIEAAEVWNAYHNRQYTADQLAKLANRGQPAETFNVIKLFARMILGYYSTVLNTIVVNPTKESSIYTAALLNDVVEYILRTNNFNTEGDKIKLGALMSGIFSCYVDVVPTGQKDRFGRIIYKVLLEYVPDNELVLDPMSTKDDYSDGKYQHRFKWIAEDDIIRLYGKKKATQLVDYFNHLNQDDTEFTNKYVEGKFVGIYKVYNNYLVVHSVITDEDGKTWSIHWCGDVELYRKEVTHKEVRFPYRIYKLNSSNIVEHYGIFREVTETQKAINQALLKIQLMVNTKKAYVEQGAVEDIDQFTDAFNRVNAVIEVLDLNGIKIDNLSREVLDQYTVIDKAFDRIQRVLSINDSFLGMAFASDSGRKVKLQQNATITAQRYLTGRIEAFYKCLGQDIISLVKQYFTAEQSLLITDEFVGNRYVTINKPMEIFSGQIDKQGQPIMEYAFEFVKDPATDKPAKDEEGNYIVAPIPEGNTEIVAADTEIEISTTAYNDEEEKNQLMLETMLSGSIGQLLAQVNPAGYFQAAALSVRTMKTKHSPDIAEILGQTAAMLQGNPQAQAAASMMASGNPDKNSQMSQQLKLPQNTQPEMM